MKNIDVIFTRKPSVLYKLKSEEAQMFHILNYDLEFLQKNNQNICRIFI